MNEEDKHNNYGKLRPATENGIVASGEEARERSEPCARGGYISEISVFSVVGVSALACGGELTRISVKKKIK